MSLNWFIVKIIYTFTYGFVIWRQKCALEYTVSMNDVEKIREAMSSGSRSREAAKQRGFEALRIMLEDAEPNTDAFLLLNDLEKIHHIPLSIGRIVCWQLYESGELVVTPDHRYVRPKV